MHPQHCLHWVETEVGADANHKTVTKAVPVRRSQLAHRLSTCVVFVLTFEYGPLNPPALCLFLFTQETTQGFMSIIGISDRCHWAGLRRIV